MGKVENIETWLSALGLETYAGTFATNDVDLAILPDLTIEDLRDLGISSVGHRRRILSAAADLAVPKPAAPVASDSDDDAGLAEKRVLTVMFCDLVDSTSLSAASDAEDFREFIAQFRQDVETAIRPFGGTVSQFLGDGVMASFGYPRASGHDAERAVAAGLAVIDRVKRLPKFAGVKPKVRVGVATGLTVVGTFDSGFGPRDDSAIGDTPNLASRLQGHAKPNTMIIAQQTRDMVGDIFECAELPKARIKGITDLVRVWKVLGRGSTTSRYEALRKRRSQAFIGRTAEMQSLITHCQQVRDTGGSLLVVEGETGIGKSRLVQQGLANLSSQVADPVVLQCSPYSANTHFFAVRYFLAPLLGDVQRGDFSGVHNWLREQGYGSDEETALIVLLMAYSEEQAAVLDCYSSDEVRAKTFHLLNEILSKIIIDAGALIIEDIQWIDPSTAELMTQLLPTVGAANTVMLGTSHLVERADWLDDVGSQTLSLERLPQEDLRQLVSVLAGETQLSKEVLETIVERSDGVPIFAEELALGYLESSAFGGAGQVPLSLSESLLARLDRLVNGKRIASLAAAIGREAPLSLLIASSDLPSSVVLTGVGELLDAGVIVASKTIFGESIRFRHGLVREAAYDLLLRRQRKDLHAKIAQTVQDRFPNLIESRPHLLALQWFYAEQLEKAVFYWTQAGQVETNRSAYDEALGYFERAHTVNETIEPSTERSEMALEIHLSRMNARICRYGFLEANDTETAEIARLVNELGSSAKAITALNLRWVYLLTTDNAHASRDFAFQIKDNKIAKTDSEKLIVLRMCATSLLFCGELAKARQYYSEFLERFDPAVQATDMKEGHSDHSLMVKMGMAESFALAGELDEARKWGDQSIMGARQSLRQHDLAHVLTFCGLLHPYLTGDYELVTKSVEELEEIVTANPLANWTGFPDLFKGLLHTKQGDLDTGWAYAKSASENLIQSQRYGNWWQVLFIDLCMTTGHWHEASKMIDLARPYLDTTEIRFKAEFYRLVGKLYRDKHNDPAAADIAFHKGLEIAKAQGADLFADAIVQEMGARKLLTA